MQGICLNSCFHIRATLLPRSFVASSGKRIVVSAAFWSSGRSNSKASILSAHVSLRWEDRSWPESSLFQQQQLREHRAYYLPSEWKLKLDVAFDSRATATMTTVSVAALEGGRQLRRRKETRISMSGTTQGVVNTNPSKQKSGKAAASESPTDDDFGPPYVRGESVESDLETRLWNLDKLDQLTTLTVVELRGLMKHMSRPTAGRKEELIGEVKRWLAERQALSIRQNSGRATRESSSDADSLEGALLKAENKSRRSGAISLMREVSAESDLDETLMEKKPVKKEFQWLNGQAVPAPKSPKSVQSSKAGNSRSGRKANNAAGKGEEVRSMTVVKDTAVDKLIEQSVEEEVTAKTSVTGQKRKTQVSKSTQSKKEKSNEKEVENSAISSKEPWTMLVHKKPGKDWIAYNPETMRPPPPPAGTKTIKLMSWNVNGLRAVMKDKEKKAEDGLLITRLAQEEDFDVLCLQETKLQEKDVELIRKSLLVDYADTFWSCSTAKPGYAGTAVLSRVKPISVKYGMGLANHDSEGRLITAEFNSFFLLTSYVPNAGEKLARLTYRTDEWDPALSQYVKELEKQKPVILTGDLNCANEEIDIHNPDGNRRSAGFTDEERASFKENFLNKGLVDTLRRQHPNAVAYTYWGYRFQCRAKNMGWRLDYFLVSEGLVEQVYDSYVRPDVVGSDHCPIGLILKL